MKDFKKHTLLLLVLAIVFLPRISFAEDRLPEVMVGQLEVTIDGQTYFGGMNGNEAVINFNTGPAIGFNETFLTSDDPDGGCYYDEWFSSSISPCFQIDRDSSIRAMTSRTKVNGVDVLELATILYPQRSIMGDVYAGSGNFSNFDLLGSHLNQSGEGGSGPVGHDSWNMEDYILNPEAQSTFANGSDSREYYESRIEELSFLADSIEVTDVRNHLNWHLEASSDTDFPSSNVSSNQYPEGKVWYVGGDLSLKSNWNYNYFGVGTIVVNGDLRINNNNIQPYNNDSLGLIVTGDVIIDGDRATDIEAVILALGDFRFENKGNFKGKGSFMANNFIGTDTPSNIHFTYDYQLESGWPPGFRYFHMPTAKGE